MVGRGITFRANRTSAGKCRKTYVFRKSTLVRPNQGLLGYHSNQCETPMVFPKLGVKAGRAIVAGLNLKHVCLPVHEYHVSPCRADWKLEIARGGTGSAWPEEQSLQQARLEYVLNRAPEAKDPEGTVEEIPDRGVRE